MDAFRNPTRAESWGKATVDIALIGLTVAKFGQASKFANAGRIGEEVAAFGKAGRAAEQAVATERFLFSKGNSTKLYRAISELELKQIQKSGKFGIGPATPTEHFLEGN